MSFVAMALIQAASVLLLTSLRDYWPSLAAFSLFGFLHSLGASDGFKDALARRTSPRTVEHFWRLLYCALSYLWFYKVIGFLHWARHPQNDAWLITYPSWMWQVMIAIHLSSIALLYAAFLQSDYLEFLGLKQAWRGMHAWVGGPHPSSPLKKFGTGYLELHGVYGWVRHPMLVGGLLFLLTSGPTKNNVAFVLMYTAYMFIGGHYEERRLVRHFGRAYVDYRSQVGAYLPRLLSRRSS